RAARRVSRPAPHSLQSCRGGQRAIERRSGMTNGQERAFDDWLADVDTMASIGYRPVLSVLRKREEFEVHSPPRGPELAPVIPRPARDVEAAPPPELQRGRHETPAERDESVTAFVELLEARRADGFIPYFILFTNDAGRLHSLAEYGIEDLPGFLAGYLSRWPRVGWRTRHSDQPPDSPSIQTPAPAC